jgi:hypothetical protein
VGTRDAANIFKDPRGRDIGRVHRATAAAVREKVAAISRKVVVVVKFLGR